VDVILRLLLREVAPGITLRDLAWRLYWEGAYAPPRSETQFKMLVGLQRRIAESVARGLSRIVPRMPYSQGNRKTGNIWSFDLPPILTCPYATFCGRPQRGGPICYDVNTARYSLQHLLREYINYIHLLRQGYQWLADWTKFVVELRGAKTIRFHVGGDVFADWYWQYIKRLAAEYPQVVFYLYTRSFPIVAASPDRPRNLKVLMSLDAANYAALRTYGQYFDHITYLAAGPDIDDQLSKLAETLQWAQQHGKRLIIFLQHTRRRQLLQKLKAYEKYICPQEAGKNITCDKCRLCFT